MEKSKISILVQVPLELKERIEHQKVRLSQSQNGLIKQAIVKFLEEQEYYEQHPK